MSRFFNFFDRKLKKMKQDLQSIIWTLFVFRSIYNVIPLYVRPFQEKYFSYSSPQDMRYFNNLSEILLRRPRRSKSIKFWRRDDQVRMRIQPSLGWHSKQCSWRCVHSVSGSCKWNSSLDGISCSLPQSNSVSGQSLAGFPRSLGSLLGNISSMKGKKRKFYEYRKIFSLQIR